MLPRAATITTFCICARENSTCRWRAQCALCCRGLILAGKQNHGLIHTDLADYRDVLAIHQDVKALEYSKVSVGVAHGKDADPAIFLRYESIVIPDTVALFHFFDAEQAGVYR